MNTTPDRTASHELLLRSLFDEVQGLVSQCDASGPVPLDGMGERSRCIDLFACSVRGANSHALPRAHFAWQRLE